MEPMDAYSCSMCKIQCNSVVTLEQHYKSAGHQRKMRESRLALIPPAGDATPPAGDATPPASGNTTPPASDDAIPPVSGDESVNAESTGNGAPGFNISNEELDYCSICDMTFNHPAPARQHYQGVKHLQRKLKLQQQEVKGNYGDCKLCHKVFEGQLQAEMHFSSKKHLDRVESANKPPVEHEFFGECTLCKKVFPFENQAKAHYESKKHLEKVKAAENPPEKKEPFGECTLCNKVFPFELQAKAHYESKKHLQKVRAKDIEDGKIAEDTPADASDGKEATTLFGKCDLCQKKFPGEAQATSHYSSKKHIQKAELEKLRSSVNDGADKGNEIKSETTENKPLGESELDLKSMDLPAINKYVSTTMSCPYCKKTFSGYQPVKDHLTSKRHIARVNMVKAPQDPASGSPTSGTTNALGSVCEDISVDECGPSEEQMVFGEILDECILNDIVNALLSEIKNTPEVPDKPIKKEAVDTDNEDQTIKTRKRSFPANEEPPVVPVRQSKRRNCK